MKVFLKIYLPNILLLIAVLFISIAFGAVLIPTSKLIQSLLSFLPGSTMDITSSTTYHVIITNIRLPHTALIALTGAALGGSGAVYQGLFRNPLADPYLIGVASGAGLGAVLGMVIIPAGVGLGLFTIPLAAFLGALVTVFTVYYLARTGKSLPTSTLILAGIAIGSFASAATTLLMLRSQGEVRRALAWLLGGATQGGWAPFIASFPYVALGLGILITAGHALNVLQFGEEQAQQMGMNVERIKRVLILAASLTTAAAVSFSGIIGFVGLIVPHLARIFWGHDYRHLIPLSILGGATMLLVADLLARIILAPQELPVGIITALVGTPFFLWVLRRARQQSFYE